MSYGISGSGSDVPAATLPHRVGAPPDLKLSEKSLELNVGAELLAIMRSSWGMPKAYLRGMTQAQENENGVDFFCNANPATQVFAFQFKAPRGKNDSLPYHFTLRRKQHELLYELASMEATSTYYVLPHFVMESTLAAAVPNLSANTWLARVADMAPSSVFGHFNSRTAKSQNGQLSANPTFSLQLLGEFSGPHAERPRRGIPIRTYGEWYLGRVARYRSVASSLDSAWLTHGMRLVFVPPDGAAA